jgi:hypothetical protein
MSIRQERHPGTPHQENQQTYQTLQFVTNPSGTSSTVSLTATRSLPIYNRGIRLNLRSTDNPNRLVAMTVQRTVGLLSTGFG